MAQAPNPNDPRPPARPNPSVESTKKDDAYDKGVHENTEGFGAAMGTGLGCLGAAFAPWIAILFAIGAAIVFIVIIKGCGK